MPISIASLVLGICCALLISTPVHLFAQAAVAAATPTLGPYEYEVKPDHEAFAYLNPHKAPLPGPLLLEVGDRLAICGDSITEQKMYSRIIETYLTVCVPELKVTVRQYGWSGEKTDGFLKRMDADCLTFKPTVATLAYGMNDSRYRPFDVTNGQWYEDHYTAIVRRFKQADVRVVVGTPGCAGKLAGWVKNRAGDLNDHNHHLCALRDIAIGVAKQEEVRVADIFWPMYQAQVFAPGQHGATEANPYDVAGKDGIHPGWAGHVIMAWAFLRALGVDGDLGTIEVDLGTGAASGKGGHQVTRTADNVLTINSTRYPFCAQGDEHRDDSIRSGMTLIPFHQDLNRFILKVTGATQPKYEVRWGSEKQVFDAESLQRGINLAEAFPVNPFTEAFERVDQAVGKKQVYETVQIKSRFHGKGAKGSFETIVAETEAERQPLADAIANSFVPVTHTLQISPVAR